MCKWNKYGDTRIDPCMRNIIKWLGNKHKTILCCCGHGKYPMTIIVKEYREIKRKRQIVFYEIFSGIILRIKKNPLDSDPKKFYKKDKEGYYYIPETIQSNQGICECGHKECDEHKSSFYNYRGLKMVAQECSVKGCKCQKFKLRKQGTLIVPKTAEDKNG